MAANKKRLLMARMALSLIFLTLLVTITIVVAVVVSGLAGLLTLYFMFGVLGAPGFVVTNARPIMLMSSILLFTTLCLLPAWLAVKSFRKELVKGEDASESYPAVARSAKRLAQQASVPIPDLYVIEKDQAVSYTIGGKSSGKIIFSTELIAQLTEEELEAVLAHEISHLANGDSRILGLAIIPLILVEQTLASRTGNSNLFIVDYPLVRSIVVFVAEILSVLLQLGIAVLSRNRELAADRGAVLLTGNPAALASALSKLEAVRTRPTEDMRTWTVSAGALDILPPERSLATQGPFRTHPRTERRLEHLEKMTAGLET